MRSDKIWNYFHNVNLLMAFILLPKFPCVVEDKVQNSEQNSLYYSYVGREI